MGPAAEGSGDLIQDQNRALKTSKNGIFHVSPWQKPRYIQTAMHPG